MKVGDLVRVRDFATDFLGLVMAPPHISIDGYEMVELSFCDGPYLACVDDCEIISESR